MLLPGPEAMQLATYVGWRLHGTKGGLAAGLLFVLPGAFVILSLSAIYVAFGNLPLVVALFLGIKSAVLVIVIEALLRIGRRALKGAEHWAIAALGLRRDLLPGAAVPADRAGGGAWGFVRANPVDPAAPIERPRLAGQTIRTALLWLAIWLVPLGALALAFGPDHILAQLGAFFSRLAVVTFGGAYAVLAYMSQDVVVQHHWLEAGQMMDGLGLAETTPGPLILVTEFVGFVAAWRNAGGGSWVIAVLGARSPFGRRLRPAFCGSSPARPTSSGSPGRRASRALSTPSPRRWWG